MTLHTFLVDNDATLRQKLITDLVEHEIQLDAAATEEELFKWLQNSGEQCKVILVGQLENEQSEKRILLHVQKQYPNTLIIPLVKLDDSRQTHWSNKESILCTVDRRASSEVIAAVIHLSERYQTEHIHNIRWQELSYDTKRAGDAKSEDQLYLQLYKDAHELLPSLDGFLIAHYDEQTDEVSFPFAYKNDKRIHIPPRKGGKSIAEYVFLTKEPLLLSLGDELFRLKSGLNPPSDELGYSNSEIVVPMLLENRKIFGAVFACTNNPEVHYTNEHLSALTAFTNQATSTIRNFIQIKEADQLRDATATLAGQRGRENVLRAIIEGAHKIVKSDFTGLILLDDNGKLQKVQPVIPENFYDKFGEPRQDGGLTREVIRNMQPMNIPDTGKNPLVKDSVRDAGIKSMLVLPLIHQNRVLGVLYTHTFAFRDFVARDIALWSAFAVQAASALERVIEEEHQISDYQRLVAGLTELEEMLSLEETLVRVATVAKSVFNSDSCRLFYIDPITAKVVTMSNAEDDQSDYHIDNTPRPAGITHHVLNSKKPYYYPDKKGGPRPRQELFALGLKSTVSLPLNYGRRDIGVLHFNYFTKQVSYNEHYKTLMEAFGARAAVALNRAAREHKAKIWDDLNREIINSTDAHELYKLFTQKAHDALGADFSVFYPYDLTSTESDGLPLNDECVIVGDLRKKWHNPRGGNGGGVFREISKRKNILIVNRLDSQSGKFSSYLARREGIQAFVAMRLNVLWPGRNEPALAGILFVNYRQPTNLKETDLANLRSVSELIAAGILQLSLREDLQHSYQQKNDQLRAIIEIFRTLEAKKTLLNLDYIAEHAARSLGLDVCTILEFDSVLQKFTGRGNFGLSHPEYIHVTPRTKFAELYMHREEPLVIEDVQKDRLMKTSKFVRREGIQSTIVCPLRAEGESVGLLFGNYRQPTVPSCEDLKSFGLFADVAAHVLHRTKLETKFNEGQSKEERRRLLVWVSMVEDMWQHTLVQKASAIQNHTFTLLKRMERHPRLPKSMTTVPEMLGEIERLAKDIANAPPRVPRDSEMKSELIPIVPLLQEIVERERRSLRLRGDLKHRIELHIKGLGGAQVYGYRRWLIYIFESLFENAKAAMPHGGQIIISSSRQKHWAEIRIQDTGKGVPFKLRDKIFNEAITGRRNHKGLGIGSLLVTTLIEENEGFIELEKPGPGDTTVLIRLPIKSRARKG